MLHEILVDDLADRVNEGYYFSLSGCHYVYLDQERVPVENPQLIILRLDGCGHAQSVAAVHLGGSQSGSKGQTTRQSAVGSSRHSV